jgi:hypothetical protein
VTEIGLVEVSEGLHEPFVPAPPPHELTPAPRITLRFLVSTSGRQALEALRSVRRALIREEGTRGRDPDEPSLEDAIFSATEIVWEVRPSQRAWCLQKLAELRRRANNLLSEMGPEQADRLTPAD